VLWIAWNIFTELDPRLSRAKMPSALIEEMEAAIAEYNFSLSAA